jgi:hypothetical protein
MEPDLGPAVHGVEIRHLEAARVAELGQRAQRRDRALGRGPRGEELDQQIDDRGVLRLRAARLRRRAACRPRRRARASGRQREASPWSWPE